MAQPYRTIAELNAQKAKLEKNGVDFEGKKQYGCGGHSTASARLDSAVDRSTSK